MPTTSFQTWLEHGSQQVPDVGRLTLLIARSGAGGMSRDGIARALGVPEETLEVLLRAMVVGGQVVAVKAGGELKYRAAM